MKNTSVGLFLVVLFAWWPAVIWLFGTNLQYYWEWFVTPFGLPVLSWPHAYGLGGAIALFSGSFSVIVKLENFKLEMKNSTNTLLFSYPVVLLLTLGLGKLVHSFM